MSRPPVAIVGMAVVLPGAPDLDTYWTNLRTGVDAVGPVPDGRHDPAFHREAQGAAPDRTYCHRGGFVDPEVSLDPARMGVMPASVPGMEPDQIVALAVAAAAVADAGGAAALGDRARVGVVLGRGGYLTPALARFTQRVRVVPQVLRTVRELLPDLSDDDADRLREGLLGPLGPFAPESTIGLVPNLAASRVANRLDLRGPAYTVDAACASSLVAVDQAVSELASGRCDAVLAGGVHHTHDETLWATFTQLGALSPTGRIAPLSAAADGLVVGEGTGIVVLKRLADARRDGDRVYAVITGVGTSSDGRTASLFAPDRNGQVDAVRRAWADSGTDPAAPGSVGMIEAHGTATRAGDDTELATLAEVFGAAGESGRAVVGSVKSMIGHTMPTAGIASLVKAALALHHATLLPTLHCAEENPLLERTRFRTLDTAEPWPGGGVRRAGVNAFGFGGINAHVVLEESGPPEEAGRPVTAVTEPEQVLLLSGARPEELRDRLARPDAAVRASRAAEFCASRAPGGDGPCRLGIVGPTDKRLAAARTILARAADGEAQAWTGRNDIWFTAEPLLPTGGTAFVFPGLEAEFQPRCTDVAEHFGLAAPPEAGEEADLLAHADGVMAVGRLLTDALHRIGVRPDVLAGHSVGEWSAMGVGGMFGDADPATLRRRFWPAGFAVPDVVFAALGCSGVDAEALLVPGVVVSHDNAPRQSVVCGPEGAVRQVLAAARAARVVARLLPFRSGFHTPMFAPHAGPFAELAAALPMHPPSVPVWSATTVTPFPADPDEVRSAYLRHLVEPVRFRPVIEGLHDGGARFFVVLGPGQLGSFVADTLGARPHVVVAANSPLRDGIAQLRRVAVACWVLGGSPDLDAATVRRRRPAAPAPTGTVTLRLDSGPLTLDPALARSLRPVPGPVPQPAGAAGLSDRVGDALAALLAETEQAASSVLAAAAPAAPVERSVVLEISLPALPYLRGHRFFRQADHAPEAERRPVVPATTIVDLVCREVERAWPGTTVTGIRDARFDAWLLAAPARHVELRMRRDPGGSVHVEVGAFARMTVRTGPLVPLGGPPPRPAVESTPPTSAAEVYAHRLMFHGPEFQGLTEISGIGPGHVRGVITVPDAPGALLDNVGQLLGVWMFAHHDDALLAFPQRIAEIDLAGPLPPAGARVECLVHASADPQSLTMDAELVHAGRVVARIRGWRDVRLDCDRAAHRAYAFPDTQHLGVPHDGGWVLVRDRWPAAAARAIHAGVYLSAAELAVHDAMAPRRAQQWLLGRIAVKDAVRLLAGPAPRFPSDVEIGNDADGRPWARARPGTRLPLVEVSLAHSGTVGVALAGPPGSAPGIDVEPVRTPLESTLDAALTVEERALLRRLARPGPDVGRWFTRFWTAKEAVGKAGGAGLAGSPRAIRVLDADERTLLVRDADGAEHRVAYAEVESDGRAHVVAWTGGNPVNPEMRT